MGAASDEEMAGTRGTGGLRDLHMSTEWCLDYRWNSRLELSPSFLSSLFFSKWIPNLLTWPSKLILSWIYCSHGSIHFLSLPQAWLRSSWQSCAREHSVSEALLAWEPAKNDACGDPPPQLYPFQSDVCSRELQKCYYVVLSGYAGCILSRAGIKFCHHCPWAICHCAASGFQSRLLLLSAPYHSYYMKPETGLPTLEEKKIIPFPLLLAILS